MAAVPLAGVSSSFSYSKRRPLALTQRRLAANRRNAARSCGPRTAKGKARIARNAIKHGFFADAARWTEQQRRDFTEIFDGLCKDFHPHSEREEVCVATIADSFVRMADLWHYENLAAVKYHRQCEREFDERVANADASEAARLRKHREELRRAGLWRPTIPGPREATAIIRYEGRLRRAIRAATAELEVFQEAKKQTHFIEERRGIFSSASGAQKAASRCDANSRHIPGGRANQSRTAETRTPKSRKQSHLVEHNRDLFQFADRVFRQSMRMMRERASDLGTRAASAPCPKAKSIERETEAPRRRTSYAANDSNEKTKPLNPTLTGNRHERRRAKALARRMRV